MPTFRLESPRDKFVNSVGPKQTVHTMSLSCDIFLRVGLMFDLFAKGNVRFFLSSSPTLPFYDVGEQGTGFGWEGGGWDTNSVCFLSPYVITSDVSEVN